MFGGMFVLNRTSWRLRELGYGDDLRLQRRLERQACSRKQLHTALFRHAPTSVLRRAILSTLRRQSICIMATVAGQPSLHASYSAA